MDNPLYPDCPFWAKDGLCSGDLNHDLVVDNCKKSCGECDSGKKEFTILILRF